MSFFKKLGGAVGGILGIRSGQSGQLRDAQEEWARQYQIAIGQNEAQRFQFENSQKLQALFDQNEQAAEEIFKRDQQASQTRVEFGTAPKRNFFSFGR